MGEFKLISDYRPGGDQPQAIDKITANIVEGKRFQTLLGATGTGKSVAWDEPVTVQTGVNRTYRGPIGRLLDDALDQEQSVESLEAAPPADWRILAWDAQTGTTGWQPITGLSRHISPDEMYRLRTACGRAVTVTGDHSVWALRDGRLHLLPGNELRNGDALPIPLVLPEPKQSFIPSVENTRLQKTDVFQTRMRDARPKDAGRTKPKHIRSEAECAASARRIGVSIPGMHRLFPAPLLPLLNEARLKQSTFKAKPNVPPLIGGGVGVRASLPCGLDSVAVQLPSQQTEVRHYGHQTPSVLRTRQTRIVAPRADSDSNIEHKGMPACGATLSNSALAALLRDYFEDADIVGTGELTTVALNRELAGDITEFLLRFGIWARMHTSWNCGQGDGWETASAVTISGIENLKRFAAQIGFVSARKRLALEEILSAENGNADADFASADFVYGVGARLAAERERACLTQLEAADRADCSTALLSAIELGTLETPRTLFATLCDALAIEDAAFIGLANVHWSPLESIDLVPASSRYVYDFSVRGYETFLTGRGGLFVHNTYTMANVIQKVQRPTLVMAHNKTLAAQLCSEFREFFPENAVEFFVSYYDYYQPEAYIPQTDTYIEKDSSVNDEINRLRHSATQSILERRDTIVVSSVSCIYGLGSPDEYKEIVLVFKRGEPYDREVALRRLIDMQFTRNDMALTRGTFRVRGDTLELQPADEEIVVRIEFFGDEVEKIVLADPLTGEVIGARDTMTVFAASHFVTSKDRMERAMKEIEAEMEDRVLYFRGRNELIEAQRIEQRTRFDLEMMRELGYCSGIENYSRFMDGRAPGTAPYTLLDYFPKDFLVILDESHQTLPQIRGMYNGDKARKDTLISYGFRLPSAADNRPLKFHEFEERIHQSVFVSATPGPFEKEHAESVVEQIIRPTGLIDPEIIIRPTKGQIDDLLEEIRTRVLREERVLVTTLTKKMAEDLTEYLQDLKIKVNYLHSDIKTMERSEILRNLRLGVHDVIVGINLLREGLDLPEVTLVAILDADKEGFLRSETSLIQTIGRAARNVGGQVIMYADNLTGSMERAIDETNRRRAKQVAYNTEHDITPQTVKKAIRDLLMARSVSEEAAQYSTQNVSARLREDPASMSLDQIEEVIQKLEKEMKDAARALNFEYAAELRDEVNDLRKLAPASKVGQETKTTPLGKDTVVYKSKSPRARK